MSREMSLAGLRRDLRAVASPRKAKASAWFFKTGKGEYGEGDIFLGVTVPEQRKIARQYRDLHKRDVRQLLMSKIHEERLIALLVLVEKYRNADRVEKDRLVRFYLVNKKRVNNWDLVDLSAPQVLGEYLLRNVEEMKVAYKLSKSASLWDRRIAILSTYPFIRNGEFGPTLRIAKTLLQDTEDLIHKAVGWMLREVGKEDQGVEEKFLRKHARKMPRTMLRYAIERFNQKKKDQYMRR